MQRTRLARAHTPVSRPHTPLMITSYFARKSHSQPAAAACGAQDDQPTTPPPAAATPAPAAVAAASSAPTRSPALRRKRSPSPASCDSRSEAKRAARFECSPTPELAPAAAPAAPGEGAVDGASLPCWPALARSLPLFSASGDDAGSCSPTKIAAMRYSVRAELNEKIVLWSGDITKLRVDAIVNAANGTLLGGGGVDGAIHRAAGRSLVRACSKLSGCAVGESKLTPGFGLPARFVIHTVGPRGKKPALLSSCYRTAMAVAREAGLRSLAFCCISTGVFGFPQQPAASVALASVRDVLEQHADDFDRVIFCVYTENDYAYYCDALPIFFPLVGGDKSADPSSS